MNYNEKEIAYHNKTVTNPHTLEANWTIRDHNCLAMHSNNLNNNNNNDNDNRLIMIELRQIDQRAKKFITIYKALHPRDEIDSLYMSKKGGEDSPALRIVVMINIKTHGLN